MQSNIEEAFRTVIKNIGSLSDEQLASLAFQAWAATQERNISPFQEEIDDEWYSLGYEGHPGQYDGAY